MIDALHTQGYADHAPHLPGACWPQQVSTKATSLICAYLVSDGYADGAPVADVRSLGFVPRVCSDPLKYLQHRYRALDGEGPRQRKPAHGKVLLLYIYLERKRRIRSSRMST
jgi:hypothetical protein